MLADDHLGGCFGPTSSAARIGRAAGYAGAIGDSLAVVIRLAEAEGGSASTVAPRAIAAMVERLQAELTDLARAAEPSETQLADRIVTRACEKPRQLNGARTDDHR